MKSFVLILLVSVTLLTSASAQDCKNFIYMTNGKVVRYISTNPKGKLVTKMVYTVKSKSDNKATVSSQVFDDKDRELTSANAEMVCEGNGLKIDMRNFIPSANASQFKGMTAKADVAYLNYPAKMQVGQDLPDGNFNMQLFKDDQKMSEITYKITERKVIGTESIDTPAGTNECYQISYTAEMKTVTFGIAIPFNLKIREWYSAKLGLFVKSEAYNKSGKLMSTTTLDSIN